VPTTDEKNSTLSHMTSINLDYQGVACSRLCVTWHWLFFSTRTFLLKNFREPHARVMVVRTTLMLETWEGLAACFREQNRMLCCSTGNRGTLVGDWIRWTCGGSRLLRFD